MGQLFDYWLEHRSSQKRSKKHDESIIRAHLRPAFGDIVLRTFALEAVHRFVADPKRKTLDPKTVANILTLLISTLNFAVELGWLARVPKIRKPRVRIFEEDYRYLRTAEERTGFLRAAREAGEDVFALYAAAVFTGMRAGELAGLRWADVNWNERIITVQRSFRGPTKAGDVRHVPILDALLPTLRAWRLRSSGAFVFTNRDDRMLLPSSRAFQEVLHRVLTRAELKGDDGARYITFHDLRHTFASHWMMNGGDLFKLQKILGHKSVQMTMRYAHLAPAAFREDYGRFGGPVEEHGIVVAMVR
jgi:integrase